MPIVLKRVYESPAPDDGYRVLVDRLWPRGFTRDALRLDEWARELAPSTSRSGGQPMQHSDEAIRRSLTARPTRMYGQDAIRAVTG